MPGQGHRKSLKKDNDVHIHEDIEIGVESEMTIVKGIGKEIAIHILQFSQG